jgi:hypothetical protein
LVHDHLFAHLNHPTLGVLFCGRAAYDRFEEIAKRTIKPMSFEAKSFHLPDYTRALRDAFAEYFGDGQRLVSQGSVAKFMNRAKELALATLVEHAHHIACTLFGEKEPDDFTLGPVRFMRAEKFFKEFADALNDYHRFTG